MENINVNPEVVYENPEAIYENPDNILQYTTKADQSIKLKECPAYGKPTVSKQPDIELEECPAYCAVKKKDVWNIYIN